MFEVMSMLHFPRSSVDTKEKTPLYCLERKKD